MMRGFLRRECRRCACAKRMGEGSRRKCSSGSVALEEEVEKDFEDWTYRRFQTQSGPLDSPLSSYVSQWLKENPSGQIHVGCDSKERKNRIIYGVAVVMRTPNVGGHIVYSKRSQPKTSFSNTFERLNHEVRQAVTTAQALLPVVEPDRLSVHVDLSTNRENLSNRLHSMATGWIQGVGLTPHAKPEAWAASAVAHRFCQRW